MLHGPEGAHSPRQGARDTADAGRMVLCSAGACTALYSQVQPERQWQSLPLSWRGCVTQGSVFSALLTDMMEAVRWGASSGVSPRGSPKARERGPAPAQQAQPPPPPNLASRVLQAVSSSSALQPSSSPNAKVSAAAASVATVALAAHPFRPLYLSGARPAAMSLLPMHDGCLNLPQSLIKFYVLGVPCALVWT